MPLDEKFCGAGVERWREALLRLDSRGTGLGPNTLVHVRGLNAGPESASLFTPGGTGASNQERLTEKVPAPTNATRTTARAAYRIHGLPLP